MAKTIVGLYDDLSTARAVVKNLEDAGFGDAHLQVATHDTANRTGYEMDDPNSLLDTLSRFEVDDNESHFYAEAVRRGGTLVITRAHDNDADKAVDIMARGNPVRYEDRMNAYKQEGFTDYDHSADAYTDKQRLEERERFADQRQQRLQEIEENLKIGKREVVRGGVRVHKYVDTERVEETLQLREEHVDVDRRRVDRVVAPGEVDDAFEEKTIELVERAEEAIVEKETRVTGEVTVGKNVETHQETVGGDVRRTRIEVEKLDTAELRGMETGFRQHYDTAYATAGRDYDYYRPAYEYGYAAGNTYRDRDYTDVERDLRTDYDSRYGKDNDSAWDDVKDAVRHGYHKAKAAVT